MCFSNEYHKTLKIILRLEKVRIHLIIPARARDAFQKSTARRKSCNAEFPCPGCVAIPNDIIACLEPHTISPGMFLEKNIV